MLFFKSYKPDLPNLKCTVLAVLLLNGLTTGSVLAYSCEAEFAKANTLITQAQELVTEDTDSRALAMIQEAKGIAEAGIISHRNATEKHTGEVGKFMHSDAVRRGKWAQELARQAIFIITGEIRD